MERSFSSLSKNHPRLTGRREHFSISLSDLHAYDMRGVWEGLFVLSLGAVLPEGRYARKFSFLHIHPDSVMF